MLTPQQIRDISTAMVGTSSESSLEAGYTYLGQMVSHDIVPPSRNPSRVVGKELWLRSLYGSRNCASLYFDSDGKFRTRGADVQRDKRGKALIPESRNDENIIVSQLHRLWQHLHNALLDQKLVADAADAEAAVVKLFQLIVIEDFLQQLVTPDVFRFHFREGRQILRLTGETIPDEFSLAAFRFGHSMVRNSYRAQHGSLSRPLATFFNADAPVPADRIIDWSLFFSTAAPSATRVQRASGIDPLIGAGMQTIERPNMVVDIIAANIKAGATLPSGIHYIESLLKQFPSIKREFGIIELATISGRLNVDSVKVEDLPLWPYLLLESEVFGKSQRLGATGSLIVADVLMSAIADAPVSVYERGHYEFRAALQSLPQRLVAALERQQANHPCNRKICMFHLLEIMKKEN